MPAADYLDFFGQIYRLTPAARQARTRQLLEHFGLAAHAHQAIGEFSKGMRQKLALARALLHNPPVLLLDEPTSAMDPESARLVRDAIHDLRSEERTLIICTHNLAEAEELADQIAIIQRGCLIVQGSPQDLKEQLLGPSEFELRLANPLDGFAPSLPEGARITTSGPNWIRYQASNAQQANPAVLRYFLERDIPVVGLQEVPRNLEQVYLQAISASRNGTA